MWQFPNAETGRRLAKARATEESPTEGLFSNTPQDYRPNSPQRTRFAGLGAPALNYLEGPSPIRRYLSWDSKSKRGIHNLGNGH
jgi:hypothetical protein